MDKKNRDKKIDGWRQAHGDKRSEVDRTSPIEMLKAEAEKEGWGLWFEDRQLERKMWSCDLGITGMLGIRGAKAYPGNDLYSTSKEQARNKISTYVLFTLPHWTERQAKQLCEPYRSDYARWAENKRKHRLEKEGGEDARPFFDDGCSLGSSNTGFSAAVSQIGVNPSNHFIERETQRGATRRQQQVSSHLANCRNCCDDLINISFPPTDLPQVR